MSVTVPSASVKWMKHREQLWRDTDLFLCDSEDNLWCVVQLKTRDVLRCECGVLQNAHGSLFVWSHRRRVRGCSIGTRWTLKRLMRTSRDFKRLRQGLSTAEKKKRENNNKRGRAGHLAGFTVRVFGEVTEHIVCARRLAFVWPVWSFWDRNKRNGLGF